ncbi:MAG: hypothetical protein ACYC27_22580 [Armatimonadota bacterium]
MLLFDIARIVGLNISFVARLMKLTLLAPDIVELSNLGGKGIERVTQQPSSTFHGQHVNPRRPRCSSHSSEYGRRW